MQSLEVISVNLWDILISLVNLLLIFFIFKRFLYKPVRRVLDKRKAAIDADYETADAAKTAAQNEQAEYAQKLQNAQNEADALMQSAVAAADRRGAKLVEDAKAKADGIMRQAQNEAALEKQRAADDIKREIADVSTLLTEKMLGREINEQDHRAWIDTFIEGIGEDDGTGN